MEAVPDFIALRVEDDGVGFDANRAAERPGRLGLLGMRHRAASVGGKLEITSAMGRGTTILAVVPLKNPIANSTE
jgi:signal transduction histidine kinase